MEREGGWWARVTAFAALALPGWSNYVPIGILQPSVFGARGFIMTSIGNNPGVYNEEYGTWYNGYIPFPLLTLRPSSKCAVFDRCSSYFPNILTAGPLF